MDTIIEVVRGQLENEFLTGGLVVVMFTAVLSSLRGVPDKLWLLIKRNLITTIDVADHDEAFFWVQKWLGSQDYTKNSKLLTATTRKKPFISDNRPIPETPAIEEVVFSPAPGWHLLKHKGSYILLTRQRKEGESITGELAYHETFVFQSFSKEAIQDLIMEARKSFYPPEDHRISVYKTNWASWRMTQRRLPRPLDSVVLEGSAIADLYEDLKWFFGAQEWYASHGIPYQRGYLFYGPPGNGKTSLAIALASAFKRDIYILNLASMNDGNLSTVISELPEHAFLLIEDVDSFFRGRESQVEDLTFSGFINAIDGVSAPTGRVLLLSTNHVEALDPAITRPGRVDRIIEFRNATPGQAQRLFLRFFPGEEQLAKAFGDCVANAPRDISMAELQEHLIQNRDRATKAADFQPG